MANNSRVHFDNLRRIIEDSHRNLTTALKLYEATGDHDHGSGPIAVGKPCSWPQYDCLVRKTRVALEELADALPSRQQNTAATIITTAQQIRNCGDTDDCDHGVVNPNGQLSCTCLERADKLVELILGKK